MKIKKKILKLNIITCLKHGNQLWVFTTKLNKKKYKIELILRPFIFIKLKMIF